MDFVYTAKNQNNEIVKGRIDAPSDDQAIAMLQQKNLLILSLELVETNVFKINLSSFFNRPSKKDLVVFTRQIATLIEADVPLLEGLKILGTQTEKQSFRKVIMSVSASIEGGAPLSVALAEHHRVFDSFYTNLVKVGEVSGKLQSTLLYLADYLERSASLQSKIKGALFYPTFVLVSLIIVAIIMMTTVIPQLLGVIRDAGVQDLPLTTRMLVFVSNFVNRYIIYMLVAAIAIAVGIYEYIKTPAGGYQWDKLIINLPRFGRIARNIYLARFAETLATLIRSGVPILEGLEVTAHVIGNKVYERILLEAQTYVKGGGTISGTLQNYEQFPSLVSSMIATGEKTGRTDFMLDNILKYYKAEAEEDIQNLAQLIEPILILILGIGVGGLVAAVLMPIYSMISAG